MIVAAGSRVELLRVLLRDKIRQEQREVARGSG